MKSSRTNQKGFTLIETIVTLVVSLIFTITIIGLFLFIRSINSTAKAYHTADALAYENLRIYANGQPPTWFKCTYPSGSSTPSSMTLIDKTDNVNGIPSPVRQIVIAEAPYGCNDEKMSEPIKITSTVIYGSFGKKITHTTYSTALVERNETEANGTM